MKCSSFSLILGDLDVPNGSMASLYCPQCHCPAGRNKSELVIKDTIPLMSRMNVAALLCDSLLSQSSD